MDKNETALHRALRYEIAQNEQLREKLMEAENELHTLRLLVADKKPDNAKITERGWSGHFICGDKCRFRRNTLIELGEKRVVVSTVGNMIVRGEPDTLRGGGCYYETCAFIAKEDGPYIDADVEKEIALSCITRIYSVSYETLPADVDNLANEMHNNACKEVAQMLELGKDAFAYDLPAQ